MKQTTKALFLSGMLVGSFGVSAALAQASGGTRTQTQTQGQMQGQASSLNGSIKVPQDNQSEGAEAAAYNKLAKVTLDQAVKAAQSSLGNTAAPSSAQLGNENGSLVWEVVIGRQSVIVDAGNAKVLQTQGVNAPETADNGESDNGESYDQAEQGGQLEQQDSQHGNAQQEQNEGGMEDGN